MAIKQAMKDTKKALTDAQEAFSKAQGKVSQSSSLLISTIKDCPRFSRVSGGCAIL